MTEPTESEKRFEEFKSEVLKRQLSNAENLDKAMLSLATAGLGFSIAFLKDFLAYASSNDYWLLYASWILFFLTIISTLVSYGSSQLGLSRQLLFAEKILIQGDSTYQKKTNFYSIATNFLTYGAALLFCLAISATTAFLLSIDLKGAKVMTDTKIGVPVRPIVDPLPEKVEKGAPIPPIPQRPVTQPPTQPLQPPAPQQSPAPAQPNPLHTPPSVPEKTSQQER